MFNNTTGDCDNGTASPQADVVFVTVYAVVFVVGLILNLVALIIFFRHTKSRSHTTVYMTNLALADLFLVLTLPVRIYYHLGFRNLNQQVCEWMGLALLVNMYGSIFLLTCMCFDRCMAVSFPMSSRVREGRKKAPLVCLCVWALTVGSSLPTYLFKPLREDWAQEEHCFGNQPVYATQPLAIFSTLTVGFGVPLIVMVVCSWGLIRAVRRSAVAQTDLVDGGKIQRMIAASLFIFLLSFLPYHSILGFLYLYREAIPCPLLVAYRYSLMLACLNAMLDPIAYYFTTETFRRKVDMDSVRKMFPLHSHSSIEGKTRGPINT